MDCLRLFLHTAKNTLLKGYEVLIYIVFGLFYCLSFYLDSQYTQNCFIVVSIRNMATFHSMKKIYSYKNTLIEYTTNKGFVS